MYLFPGMPVPNMHPLLDRNDLKVLCQYLFLDVMAIHQQDQDASADLKDRDGPIRCANSIYANSDYFYLPLWRAH
jgi:hypothetical protein